MQCSVPDCKQEACCEKTYRFEAMFKLDDTENFIRQPWGFVYCFCKDHKETHEPDLPFSLASEYSETHEYDCSVKGCLEPALVLQAFPEEISYKCKNHLKPSLVPIGTREKISLATYSMKKLEK